MLMVSHGLFDHMVLQRNHEHVSDAIFGGRCDTTGPLRARVFTNGKPLKGWAHVVVGRASRRKLKGRLRGLPVGGPYDIELSIVPSGSKAIEHLWISDVLVGDVWLMAGQSNMQGYGLLREALPPVPQVRAFFMDHHWRVAKEPIHNMDAAVDAVHRALNGGGLPPKNAVVGTSPGPGFAQEMLRRTGVPQGLIAAAHGGTSMAQWDPSKRSEGSGSLYGALIGRLRKNGGRAAGLIWYQGESDANTDAMKRYTKAMIRLVRALRRDCGNPKLPVASVQISRVIGWSADASRAWNSIQDQQRRLHEQLPHFVTVPAIDLTLADAIHISGRDENRLGVRLAQAMDVLRRGKVAGLPPIELGRIRTGSQPGRKAMGMVEVEFRNVVGRLRAGSRPTGLTLSDGVNPPGYVFDIQLKGHRAFVYTTLAPAVLPGLSLQYGAGTDPYCNITDEADRSVPAFGPEPLGVPKAMTPFWRTADMAWIAQPYTRLGRRAPQPHRFQRHTFPADFSNGRFIFPGWPKDDSLLVYRYVFSCAERMALDLLIGYDGPITVWLNGKRVHRNPHGTNPAVADQHAIPFTAKAGSHQLLVALGNQLGRAWGIWVRLARRDVSKTDLRAGLPVALPGLRTT